MENLQKEPCLFCEGTGQVVSSTTISGFKTCDCSDVVDVKYEETLLEDTLKYKKEYLSCPWWKFRKKNKLYHQWQDKLDSIIRSGIARKKIKQR